MILDEALTFLGIRKWPHIVCVCVCVCVVCLCGLHVSFMIVCLWHLDNWDSNIIFI